MPKAPKKEVGRARSASLWALMVLGGLGASSARPLLGCRFNSVATWLPMGKQMLRGLAIEVKPRLNLLGWLAPSSAAERGRSNDVGCIHFAPLKSFTHNIEEAAQKVRMGWRTPKQKRLKAPSACTSSAEWLGCSGGFVHAGGPLRLVLHLVVKPLHLRRGLASNEWFAPSAGKNGKGNGEPAPMHSRWAFSIPRPLGLSAHREGQKPPHCEWGASLAAVSTLVRTGSSTCKQPHSSKS